MSFESTAAKGESFQFPNWLWNLDCGQKLQLKPGKRGAIARNAPPILDRINLSAELWPGAGY